MEIGVQKVGLSMFLFACPFTRVADDYVHFFVGDGKSLDETNTNNSRSIERAKKRRSRKILSGRPVNLIKASDEWRLFLNNVKVSLDDAMEIYADAKQVLLDF
mmetsp:Transcript_14349/g.16280  ORF Transcript_14349/g.16280 Transcript_14349/m.16280 type:complete len:103 (+) Transcript_14349:3017-3325(+)